MKTNLLTGGKWPILLGLLLLAAQTTQAQFNFITNNGAIIITGYTGPTGPVTIPATLNGLPVTAIQETAGFENKGITSVAIPGSVTNIQPRVFAPNPSLTVFTVDSSNQVYSSAGGVLFDKNQTTLFEYPPGLGGSYIVPGSVTNIGDSAFSACYYLSSVTISNSVTIIGPQAFGVCFGLTSVAIPASVTSIGPEAFLNCHSLTAFTVDPGNAFFSSVGGVLFDKNQATLITYPVGLSGSYAIPDGVITIGTGAFYLCNGLTSVTMPASVTTLADSAFADCGGLTTITLGAGVNQIATTAFGFCNQLTAINVNPTNPVLSSIAGVVFDKSQTTLIKFPPGYLGSYTTPGSVTSIAAYAAEDCALSAVTLTAGVTSIGDDAFQGCGNLTNVTILSPVTSMGLFTFADCPKLATVIIHGTVSSFGIDAFIYSSAQVSFYFLGNAPAQPDPSTFLGDTAATVYYLAGTTGWSSNFGGLPTVELEPIAITASPTNGPAPLTVSFTAAAVDNADNPVTNWNWDFGDGSTSTAQNPSHLYTTIGAFTAAVVETNSLGIPIAGMAATIQSLPPQPGISGLSLSGANLVLNGTNGLSGLTYYVLASTNIVLPLNQWLPVTTNILSLSGNFTITVSNTFTPAILQQFYILKTQ
ncbi:MAG TPA: leucine-rich repeat protein [Verrucomicrobiae bacterium]|nr:leucine-rich repeat protein [Verrucomicrobiae bacterium]